MNYQQTKQEQAFIKAFKLCFGSATNDELNFYFANKELAQTGTMQEQSDICDSLENWSNIEDAWLLWLEAVEYAREAACTSSAG